MGAGLPRILINAASRTRAETVVLSDVDFEARGSCLAGYALDAGEDRQDDGVPQGRLGDPAINLMSTGPKNPAYA